MSKPKIKSRKTLGPRALQRVLLAIARDAGTMPVYVDPSYSEEEQMKAKNFVSDLLTEMRRQFGSERMPMLISSILYSTEVRVMLKEVERVIAQKESQ